jgi:hypothetical protein
MKMQDTIPVLVSIFVIILIAVIEKHSRFFAAITATMPLTAALGLWIVYSSSSGDSQAVSEFSLGLVLAIIPTLGFLLSVWLLSRAGYKLLPMLALGYSVWAAGMIILLSIRKILNF